MSQCPYCEWTADSVAEEVEHMQLAHPEIIRERLEAAGMADESDKIDVIKLDDTEEFVMVRLVEWAEWIPGHPDAAAGLINVHNGITGFSTSKSEKLMDVHVLGTGRNLDFKSEAECPDCEGKGKVEPPDDAPQDAQQADCQRCEGGGFITQDMHYGYYTFQAVLAQNVSKQLLESLKMAQQMPIIEEHQRQQEEGRDRRKDLTIVQHKAPPPPPRRKRKR